jgi:hypothetical protein
MFSGRAPISIKREIALERNQVVFFDFFHHILQLGHFLLFVGYGMRRVKIEFFHVFVQVAGVERALYKRVVANDFPMQRDIRLKAFYVKLVQSSSGFVDRAFAIERSFFEDLRSWF